MYQRSAGGIGRNKKGESSFSNLLSTGERLDRAVLSNATRSHGAWHVCISIAGFVHILGRSGVFNFQLSQSVLDVYCQFIRAQRVISSQMMYIFKVTAAPMFHLLNTTTSTVFLACWMLRGMTRTRILSWANDGTTLSSEARNCIRVRPSETEGLEPSISKS